MKNFSTIPCIIALTLSVIFCGCGNTNDSTPTTVANATTATEEVQIAKPEDETPVASTPENPLDIEAIEKIEAEDNFEVKIVNKSVIEDYGLTVSMAGNDALVFEVENSSSETVTSFEIYLVGYDSNNDKVSVGMGATIHEEGQSRFVTIVNPADNTEIKPGETISIMTRCKAETFEGVKAIIGSYTDSNGDVHENPIINDWYAIAYDAVTLE